jgi:hypothetical protein
MRIDKETQRSDENNTTTEENCRPPENNTTHDENESGI